jgi:hypothetical protein
MSLNASSNVGPSYQDWEEILGSKSVTSHSGAQTGTEKSDADTASDMTVHRPSSPRSEKETPDMFELLRSNKNLRPFSPSDDEHEDKELEWTTFIKELRELAQAYRDNAYRRYPIQCDFLLQELYPSFNRTGLEKELVSVLFYISVIAKEENKMSIIDSQQQEHHQAVDIGISENARGEGSPTIERYFGQGSRSNIEKCINQKQDGGWLRLKQSHIHPTTGEPVVFYAYYGLFDPKKITQWALKE